MLQKYFYPIIVTVALLFFAAGFALGKVSTQFSANRDSANIINPLFNSQVGTFRGQIIAINGDILRVVNSSSKQEGDIRMSDNLKINHFDRTPENATPSALLEINKEVLIKLELVRGEFIARSIDYIALPPPVPPFIDKKDQQN